MKCEEVAEYISVLCDGESIPTTVAEHVRVCEACQSRLKAYRDIGTELRRVARSESPKEVRARTWDTKQRTRSSWWGTGLEMLAPLPLVAWLYASIIFGLFLQWNRDPTFIHGIFVPFFALFVLQQDRKKLKAIESAPSWAGLPLIAVGLIVLVWGVLGVELFASRVSLLILIAGLITLFRGWTFFRAVLFPWAALILMIPIPNKIANQIAFPLQLLAAKLATALLVLVGVPALRQGNVIELSSMSLQVAEACSGILSFWSLVTLAIIYGYLMDARTWVRVVLACLAVPVIVVANSFRIIGTGLLMQYSDMDKAEWFYRALGGWPAFVLALIILFAVHRVISVIWKCSPDAPHDLARGEAQPAGEISIKARSLRLGVVVGLMLFVAILIQTRRQREVIPPRLAFKQFPTQLGGWTGTDVSINEEMLNVLKPSDYLLRIYQNSQERAYIDLFIEYFRSQRESEAPHSPQHCLPGSGWTAVENRRVTLTPPGHEPFSANRYVIAKGDSHMLVLYWFWAHDRGVANEYWAKYYLVRDRIKMNRSDGALVRIITKMYPGETVEAAQQRALPFVSEIVPLLNDYIPR